MLSSHFTLLVRRTLALLASVAFATSAHAWGAFGHELTATVAWNALDSAAQKKITAILSANPDIIQSKDGHPAPAGLAAFQQAATWPDVIKSASRNQSHPVDAPLHIFSTLGVTAASGSGNLHFADCDASGHVLPPPPSQLNAIHAVPLCVAALRDPKSTDRQRGEALAFLVHLLGDLHQPLHAGNAVDKGGNDITGLTMPAYPFIGPQKYPVNELHAVWDGFLFQTTNLTTLGAYYTQRLQPRVADTRASGILKVTDPAQWAAESHALALKTAYVDETGQPIKNGATLTKTYMDKNLPIADQRVLEGGLRLAQQLKAALGK